MGTFDPLLMAVEAAIQSARLERERVMTALPGLREAYAAGDPRALNHALREVTPTEVWDWPAYQEWAVMVGEKRVTRLKMVEALTHFIYGRSTRAEKHKQALEGRERNPLWEFRPAGDGRDWPDCRAKAGFRAEWNDPRWRREMLAPFFCQRVGCRCAIRTYSTREMQEKGIGPMPPVGGEA